jgi:hypothetical protein
MKILPLFILLFLTSCTCKKNIPSKEIANAVIQNDECPENGICSIELLKNKSLNVKNDEFGKMYYILEDNKAKNVIRYTFNKDKDETLQDSGYREEVIFEIDPNGTQWNFSNENLQETKMLFGRFCFCRGATGYYKVTDGTLLLKKEKESMLLELNFKITEVPQIITKIHTVFK